MADEKREHAIGPVELPADIDRLAQGRNWSRNTVGESGDAVYRLQQPGGGADLYLKHGRGACALDLAGEMVRLRWLGTHISVPAVRHFTAAVDEAWLLMTALPGQTAYQQMESSPGERITIVASIAGFLRQLHAIPVESCPFNSDHRLRLGEAWWRLEAGLVDICNFQDSRLGWTAQQVWDAMTGLLPFEADSVVTHGDFSLENLIVVDNAVVGCIDVGRAGIADRYQDLAILWNCLRDFGPDVQNSFFSAYGTGKPEEGKIEFHLMLDELF